MESTQQFKTNIKCGGCLAKVKPHLDELPVEWDVDLKNPDKRLTVKGDIDANTVEDAVRRAGFNAEPVQ